MNFVEDIWIEIWEQEEIKERKEENFMIKFREVWEYTEKYITLENGYKKNAEIFESSTWWRVFEYMNPLYKERNTYFSSLENILELISEKYNIYKEN